MQKEWWKRRELSIYPGDVIDYKDGMTCVIGWWKLLTMKAFMKVCPNTKKWPSYFFMNSVKVEQNIYCGGGTIVNIWVNSLLGNGMIMEKTSQYHCLKSVCIRSYSGPYFPAFGLNIERYGVSLFIRTRITLNTDTFYTVYMAKCFY